MRLLVFGLLLALAAPAAAQPLPALQGDAEAVSRLERMFVRLGGREPWARAQSMYLHYRQLSSGQLAGEGEERAWRDIARSREHLEWRRTQYDGTVRTWARGSNERGGWRRNSEGLRAYTPEEHRMAVTFWPRDFYTMFRRMAAGDPALRYRFTAPNSIVVTDREGQPLGWWDIDAGGTLFRWGTTDDDGVNQLSYIYGPYRSYGAIAFPAWGVSADGLYRFEYLDFAISPNPLPDAMFEQAAGPPPAGTRLPGN